jgi:hypothetical protein
MSQAAAKAKASVNGSISPRRWFVSTALLGGLTAALAPSLRAAPATSADAAVPDVLPSPADSLSLYVNSLDQIKNNILHPYFRLVGCLAGEVRSRYQQLRDDVTELERLVPQLRAGQETSSLKTATDIGQAGASGIQSMAEGRVAIADAHLTLISSSSERLNDLLAGWQQQGGSLRLPPRAVELLRKILREVHDLDKPTEGLNVTSKLLTDVDNDLTGKVAAVKTKIQSAISVLIAEDLSHAAGPAPRQDDAVRNIQTAVTQLQQLDAYTPPESLRDYLAHAPAGLCQESHSLSGNAQPTKTLRALLEGTARWIVKGGQLSLLDGNSQGDAVAFVRTSMSRPTVASGFGLWYSVRQVLRDLLPDASRMRTFSCLALIAPALAAYDPPQRAGIIYDLLPYLFPSGPLDLDDFKRRQAAQRLANL